MSRKATDIFSEWASIGRDEGMQKNHWNAVKNMFQTLIKEQSKPFSFIDAGCGNGWAVREMKKILIRALIVSFLGYLFFYYFLIWYTHVG